jgi:hypothetical protein
VQLLPRARPRGYDPTMLPARQAAARARRALLASLTLTLGLALAPSARAWHASGHMQIALLAYDALGEPAQRRLVELLRQHPRFQQDFVPSMPAGLSDAAQARWIFAFAASWPDVARNQPEYHHGSWHWINYPLTLKRDGALSTCAEAKADFPASVQRVHRALAARAQKNPGGPPPPPAAPASEPAKDSLLDALPRQRARLQDASAPAAERALALSWVLHLVGDAHQPLHAVALFTPRLFETGDRGGNELVTKAHGSLHVVWDGALGGDEPFEAAEHNARALAADRTLDAARASAKQRPELARWLEEDCALARSHVYVPAVLAAVQAFEASGKAGKPELELPPAYFADATKRSRERSVQAGVRLAAWLTRP